MSLRQLTAFGASVLLCATLFSGCSKDSDRVVTGQSAPIPAGGGSTVAALTGDDDSQVSAETQLLVARAVALDENDAPLDF